MTAAKSKETIPRLCPRVDPDFVADFLGRIADDYFQTFSAREIANHIRMSFSLDEAQPLRVRIAPRRNNEFEITIAGFDYPSEFSIFCGLLSAFGLDIRAGNIYSISSKQLSRRIVDVLRVASKTGEIFDRVRQQEFEGELQIHAELLANGAVNESRERLHRFLIERIEKMDEGLGGLASPVELLFDNRMSPEWTLLTVRAEDTFGFLYAISNALAMREVNIHKVKIRGDDGRVDDVFSVANRQGLKIDDAGEQERLRTAVSMLKQFTRFLPQAPDPARALRHFDQFLDKLIEMKSERFPDRTIAFLASDEGMNILAHLLGSSDFLWDDLLLVYFLELVPALEDFHRTQLLAGPPLRAALQKELRAARSLEDKKRVLNAFKDRHVFLIDAAHIVQPHAPLTDFSFALTELGEIVLQEAVRVCYEHLNRKGDAPRRFAIFGLGKFGGREMGYASDFELLFVHESSAHNVFFESFVRLVVDFIEARSHGIFHIDMRLRPYGEAGRWSTPFEQLTRYYSVHGDAEPFERQALIKLRWIAGDTKLGRRVEAQRDAFTYSGAPWDWADAMHLRHRQIDELVKAGKTNVKYSAGGIVDIEYAVQYLQILNGAEHPEIRLSNTLEALEVLRRFQIIRENDYATLHRGYLFLRNLIDGLRIVRGDATDLVLPDEDSEEFKSLARRLGYRESDRVKGAARLHGDILEWMTKVHDYFVMRFDFERQS